MLPVSLAHLRLALHLFAACVWVGGQVTLGGLVPALRPFGPDATRAAARRFSVIAWTAFAVLVVTGIWNVTAVHVGDASTAYRVTLLLKLLAVGVTAGGTVIHVAGRSRTALAVGGALSSLGAVAALFLGVVLHG